jgi:hypothetical protein
VFFYLKYFVWLAGNRGKWKIKGGKFVNGEVVIARRPGGGVVNRMELLVRTGIKNEIERVLDITTYGQPAFNNRAKQIVLQIRNADGDINERG